MCFLTSMVCLSAYVHDVIRPYSGALLEFKVLTSRSEINKIGFAYYWIQGMYIYTGYKNKNERLMISSRHNLK